MYEIVIIILLILINGILAMSEIAFVSSKKFKLEDRAKKGSEAAKKALELLREPEKFLSAVQIGITLVGILAGAFGGYAMAEDLTPFLNKIDFLKPYSIEISFAIIVSLITYLSLVIGELVPKSIALKDPEKITLLMAGLMYFISKAFAPFVWFLSISTKFIIVLFRIKKSEEPPISEDELKSLLYFGTVHGTFEKEESEMIMKIFSFNDKRVSEILIPRTEIEWIDSTFSNQEVFQFISTHQYSKYVVCERNLDNLIGILDSKEFLLKYHQNASFDLRSILTEPLIVPYSIYSIELFEKFRINKTNIALIVDEHGGTEGLITLHDLIENIVGDIPEKFETPEHEIVRRMDGSYLIDGSTDIRKAAELLSLEFSVKDYTTLGGFFMERLGKIPKEGDIIRYSSYKFEIVDMDGNRVDKVLVEKSEKTVL
ncbi:MAG TPA: hemolysin family protein [Ignavibacteriaceae bacterium]|nr:hemolysin family protein [Ignavibacteriaceae bacterium]